MRPKFADGLVIRHKRTGKFWGANLEGKRPGWYEDLDLGLWFPDAKSMPSPLPEGGEAVRVGDYDN